VRERELRLRTAFVKAELWIIVVRLVWDGKGDWMWRDWREWRLDRSDDTNSSLAPEILLEIL